MTAKLVLSAACVLGLITVGLSFMDKTGTAQGRPYAKASAYQDDFSAADSHAEMENLQSALTADSLEEAKRLSRVNKRPIMVVVEDGSKVVDKFRRNQKRGLMDGVNQKVIEYTIQPNEKETVGVTGSITLIETDGSHTVSLGPDDRLNDLSIRISQLYKTSL